MRVAIYLVISSYFLSLGCAHSIDRPPKKTFRKSEALTFNSHFLADPQQSIGFVAKCGYYAYVYGNLWVSGLPAALHYDFDKKPGERSYKLYPLAIDDRQLQIHQVLLDGRPYEHFIRDQRILHLAPQVAGIFAVTYHHTSSVQ